MDTYSVSMGFHGFETVESMNFQGNFMDFHEDFSGILSIFQGFFEYFHGFSRMFITWMREISMDIHGYPWYREIYSCIGYSTSMDTYDVSMDDQWMISDDK